MRRIIITIAVLTIFTINLRAERPGLYGFVPAAIDSVVNLGKVLADNIVYNRTDVELIFDIDENGDVLSVESTDTLFDNYAQCLKRQDTLFRFVPAQFEGMKVKSKLKIKVSQFPRRRDLRFTFPVNDSSIIDESLFLASIDLNDIDYPEIIEFPSYYCDLDFTDSLVVYPIIILKIKLDKGGKLVDVSEEYSNYGGFTDQLKSAVLYAKFKPAMVHGNAIQSTAYLAVSFFNQLNYPTVDWKKSEKSQMGILEQNRVKLFPEKLGLINKPLPKKVPGDLLALNSFPVFIDNPIEVWFTVKANSVVNVMPRNNKDDKLREYLSRLTFYPAIDFSGNPVKYDGILFFTQEGKSNVRIHYKW